MRRIEVEFGLKITEVTPEELGPLFDQLARLSRNGVQMSKETEKLLAAYAPPVLAAALVAPVAERPPAAPEFLPVKRRACAPALTESCVIAALTAWRGDVSAAALAIGTHEGAVYKFCRSHKIVPATFRLAEP